ncbi:MAG: EAL domain-containing protein [Desulfovibrio sp.]|nr:EAL domain-containing protein [Desulfovibrio sp.]
MSQLYSLLGAAVIRLKQHTYDWSNWDEAYEYIENKNHSFILKNLNKERLRELHITAAAFYDLDGERLIFIDGSNLEYGDDWVDAESALFDRIAKMIKRSNFESTDGFVMVKGVGMIIAANKIYDSEKQKSFRGFLIMASALDAHFKEKAYSISALRFSFLPVTLFTTLYAAKTKGENFKLLQTEDEIRVYSIVNDIFWEPAFCLELRRKREIAAFGEEISHKNFWLTLSLCISILLAGVAMLSYAYRRFLREEMTYQAKHDSLTGLPNGDLLIERFPKIIKIAQGIRASVGLLYLDVDNFKSINDSYGYQQGDAVLREIANRLRTLNSTEALARTSVDNFHIVITAANQDLVLEKAQKILDTLKEIFFIGNNKLHISISIGLAYFTSGCSDILTLIHHAELAMYDAKQQGGNTISLYNKSMTEAVYGKKQLETALYEAVEKEAFIVNYQPKVDISKNDIAGCEALVRWQTGDGKWVPPPAFIPIAEETGLVTSIDMFVLRTACRQVLAWEKDGSGAVPIAVNMSVRSILSEGFAERVMGILEEEGTPPSLIDLEITETCFMSDMETAFAAISRLHEGGMHIALDDFGTGYSSLQYLSAMPISFLKIDRKFVDDIFSGKMTAQPLVRSIIALAANLGMHVICEGVEDKNQLAFLAGNGAHIIQGYLFSKPLSAADCGEFLQNRKAHIAEVMQSA